VRCLPTRGVKPPGNRSGMVAMQMLNATRLLQRKKSSLHREARYCCRCCCCFCCCCRVCVAEEFQLHADIHHHRHGPVEQTASRGEREEEAYRFVPAFKVLRTPADNFSAGHNPKAFSFANPGKLQKQATRSHDVLMRLCPYAGADSLTSNARIRSRKSDCTSRLYETPRHQPVHDELRC
jgi:hypothetical protein